MIQHQQRGFTLIELMAALGIGLMMLVGLSTVLDMSLQDAKGQQAGQYQAQFVAAATRYLSDNYTTLVPAPTSSLTRLTVDLVELQAKGLLPTNFALTNVYGQTPCMLLHKPDPAKGQIDALIVTEGGTEIPQADISYLAANAGAGGGAITYDRPGDIASATVARGVVGGWQLDATQLGLFTANTCSGTAAGIGHLASSLFYGSGGQAQNEFLYRKTVAGNPGINQMDAPIGMGVNALKTAGDGCSAAQIAMDAVTGSLLTCDLGAGAFTEPASTHWKGPQANYAAITAMPSKQGDVSIALDTGRAWVSDGVGAWSPLGQDYQGNLTMAGDLQLTGTPAVGGLPAIYGNITTNGNVTIGDLDVNGYISMTSDQWFTQTGTGGIAQAGGSPGIVQSAGARLISPFVYGETVAAQNHVYATPFDPGTRLPKIFSIFNDIPCAASELNGFTMDQDRNLYLCFGTPTPTYHFYSAGPRP
jgi:prepilin-type N-terminal cleavage/methylation domain-containing protein